MSIALLVKKVLGASGHPLTASRIVLELGKLGFANIKIAEVNSYLYMGQCNGTVRKVEIEGITASGWLLLVASTQSRRQRIQRIGRALRKGDGTKRPIVITLHVPGTSDGNVIADDGEIFGDAAKIFSVGAHDCISTLKILLKSPDGKAV